jgi:hypothetical protein
MPTQPAQPRAPAIDRLTEMLTVRGQISAEKVAAENASRMLEDAMVQRLSRVASEGSQPISTSSTAIWLRL